MPRVSVVSWDTARASTPRGGGSREPRHALRPRAVPAPRLHRSLPSPSTVASAAPTRRSTYIVATTPHGSASLADDSARPRARDQTGPRDHESGRGLAVPSVLCVRRRRRALRRRRHDRPPPASRTGRRLGWIGRARAGDCCRLHRRPRRRRDRRAAGVQRVVRRRRLRDRRRRRPGRARTAAQGLRRRFCARPRPGQRPQP